MSKKEKVEVAETNENSANHLANVHSGDVKTETAETEEKKEEVAPNHLADVHAGETTETAETEEKKEEVQSALADIHSENPKDKDGEIITNAHNNDPNSETNKSPDEVPTHLGGIKLETENETESEK